MFLDREIHRQSYKRRDGIENENDKEKNEKHTHLHVLQNYIL